VAAADRESEQRQRLADFFDENGINNRLQTAVEKLTALQNSDGSFSWYPGMEGSTYITVAITEMLARLQSMGCNWPVTPNPAPAAATPATPNPAIGWSTVPPSTLYANAFNYLSKAMTDLVAEMQKEEKKGHRQTFPSFTALRWLYLCAIDGRTLKADVKAANNYLIKLLKKDIKRQTIYEKAMTTVVLAKNGEKTKAAEYVKSLKEYTVFTEEMGRYYDTRRAGYSWYDYKIPTEVAAIEAIQLVTPQDKQTVDEMRRWLLQEKRTQTWNTPINTVNAIYAFLNGNSQVLTANGQQPPATLALDGTPLATTALGAPVTGAARVLGGSPAESASPLGYVKAAQPYKGEHAFTATKTSEGTSWGAVYAQFLQKSSDIEAAQSGITVKRQLLTANSLTVGQRIRVRITIETTRDLDFVQVVDRRAACMEPVNQLSGYHNGAYCSPKDYATHYFFRGLSKGKHVIETEYYIDRAGTYETGTCTVGCAYAPEFRATAPSVVLKVEN
jgi:sRNA-binding regulator protein Hfq